MPFDLMLSACLFKKVLYSPKVPPSLCLSEQNKKIPTGSQNLFSPLLLLLEQAPTLFLSLYIIFHSLFVTAQLCRFWSLYFYQRSALLFSCYFSCSSLLLVQSYLTTMIQKAVLATPLFTSIVFSRSSPCTHTYTLSIYMGSRCPGPKQTPSKQTCRA